jgi:NTP pyrophosphatase (non-canonical NTP hydrolase)
VDDGGNEWSLAAVAAFAGERAQLIREAHGIDGDELTALMVVKLQEEVGEVAEAYLTLRGVQRAEKLTGSEADRRAALGRELGDVAIVVSLLAHSVGLDIDQLLPARIAEVVERD